MILTSALEHSESNHLQPSDILAVAAEFHQSKKAAGATSDDLFANWLPGAMGDRTLIWDVFDYVFETDRKRRGRIRIIRTYRNPVFLAREWAEAIQAGGFPTRRAFAKAIRVSHARVSQVLGLLQLSRDARDALVALGDPLHSRKLTERKLRPVVKFSGAEQVIRLKGMI